jgi:NAD(P)H-flavin reductase
MIQAAEQDTAPPWWVGEVVAHERRTPDIAVVTVQPGQRLPFEAGQYVSVQVSRWPRVWRPFSVANAPREDGRLRFHVRALPAGWVSGSLVRHTKIGDTLLLGPPLGSMTLDPESDRDLLLVAGGTGLAPLKALAEQVMRSGRHRNIHLIVGARTERELYDLPDLRVLEQTYPWLRVIPVVSAERSFDGMHGEVGEVLDRFHGWADHDVYLCGPARMIDQCVRTLQRLGVPPARLHHDPLTMS